MKLLFSECPRNFRSTASAEAQGARGTGEGAEWGDAVRGGSHVGAAVQSWIWKGRPVSQCFPVLPQHVKQQTSLSVHKRTLVWKISPIHAHTLEHEGGGGTRTISTLHCCGSHHLPAPGTSWCLVPPTESAPEGWVETVGSPPDLPLAKNKNKTEPTRKEQVQNTIVIGFSRDGP